MSAEPIHQDDLELSQRTPYPYEAVHRAMEEARAVGVDERWAKAALAWSGPQGLISLLRHIKSA